MTKSLRGRTKVIGPAIKQSLPIELDPAAYEGAIVYAEDTTVRVSDGTSWNLVSPGVQGIQGTQGNLGLQGTQGIQGEKGIQGETGIQGDLGIQGIQGAQGTSGIQGDGGTQGTQGIQGIQGLQGNTGTQGTQGTQGNQGSQGTTGIQGAQGIQGTFGPSLTIIGSVADVNINPPNNPQTTLNNAFPGAVTGNGVIDEATGDMWVYDGSTWENVGQIVGPQGTQGVQGIQGAQGIQGPQGTTGIQGAQGTQGTQGTQGAQGTQGNAGSQGTNGTQGTQGAQGLQGTQGNTGIQGVQGTQGTQGTQGAQGIQGNTGIQGGSGIQGARGFTGFQGVQGTQGNTGIQGSVGTQGTQGVQGRQGTQGIQGRQGTQGIQGITGPSTTINATNDTTTNSLHFPVFVGALGSNQTAKGSSTKLAFNPSTGKLFVSNTEVLTSVLIEQWQSGGSYQQGEVVWAEADQKTYRSIRDHSGLTIEPSNNQSWDISSASFVRSFSVASQDTAPGDVFFKPDGTKMYVIGSANDAVYEYDLSTPWDISSAFFVQSFSVASQETTPTGLFFKPDGTKMYVIGSANDAVYEYDLSTPWDISSASFVQSFSVASQNTSPVDVFFKPDGTKMYMLGASGQQRVYEYDLSTPWDISSASFVQSFSVFPPQNLPTGIFFRSDGAKMYVIGALGDLIYEYDLSTPWDVLSASLAQDFSVASQDTFPTGLFFKPDGTKIYVIGTTNDTVYEYSIVTWLPISFTDEIIEGTIVDSTIDGSVIGATTPAAATFTTISKSSGSFRINHPILNDRYLVHSFVESPKADNIYRGIASLANGIAMINIDEASNMTDGTFVALNRNAQCFAQNITGFKPIRASVNGNILMLESSDFDCYDQVSWLVIGERQDKEIVDADWTDETGRVIVEPSK
jgi:DNA-binding beta-propeller fold protein YncE